MPDSDRDHELSDDQHQRVEDALSAILATEKFEAAPQMSAFLRYVVEQASQGNQSRIKAFTVAVDALGKPDTFDPQNDPVVRVLAGRLRSALTAYNADYPDIDVMISMSRGSYVPAFQFRDSTSEASALAGLSSTDHEDRLNSHAKARNTSMTDEAHRANTIEDADSESLPGMTTAPPAGQFAHDMEEQLASTNDSTIGNSADSNVLPPKVTRRSSGFTTATISAMMLAAFGVGYSVSHFQTQREPQLLTALPDSPAAQPTPAPQTPSRVRPDSPAVFISAIDRGNSLENTLNTLMSNEISNSDIVCVYRILDKDQPLSFWPEDYILSLSTLRLQDETLINLQLVQAKAGRVVYTQTLSLSARAAEQLSKSEIDQVMTASRSIASRQGPLLSDYAEQLEGG